MFNRATIDTGPGKPGIDNNHTPGSAYSSGHVEDAGCSVCRRESARYEHDGVSLWGTEGQSEIYIWLARGDDVLKKGAICNACLIPLEYEGRIELVKETHQKRPDNLSDAARHELFALGARSKLAAYHDIRDVSTDGCEDDLILPLSESEIDKTLSFAGLLKGSVDPQDAGEIYAMAVLAFGYARRDPGFDISAVRYIEKLAELEDSACSDERLLRLLVGAPIAALRHPL